EASLTAQHGSVRHEGVDLARLDELHGGAGLVTGAHQGLDIRPHALEVVQAAAVGEQLIGMELGREYERPPVGAPERSAALGYERGEEQRARRSADAVRTEE